MRSTVWAVVALVVGGTLARVASAAGMADTWVAVPVLAVYPWLVLATLLGALGAGVLTRRHQLQWLRAPTTILALTAVIGVVVVAPRTIPQSQPAADGELVTIGVVNVRRGLADAQRIAKIVTNTGIDVLAVIELTTPFDDGLRRAAVAAALPHAIVAPTQAAGGGGVYSAAPIEALRPPDAGGDTPDVTVDLPGGTVLRVTTTHPVPPIGPRRTRTWRDGLERVGAAPQDMPAMVVGDFNATLDHATFRALLAAGWRDAAREAGQGLAATYDGFLDGSPGLPMAIDHILVGPGIGVGDVRAYDIDGTDHRLLVADLQLPGPAS